MPAMAELSLDDLAMFVRVVERGGFSSAARRLGVPTSNVSRAVARLESQSGVQLFHRTTRTVKATSEGQELFASVAPAMTTLRGAMRTIEPAARKPNGLLRVTAPNDLAATYLADIIVGFTATYPFVRLDFSLSNAAANLVDEGFDVAIRAAARMADSSLVARKLGEVRLGLYAAPSYLKKHSPPASKDDLARHACVVFRGKELARTWPLIGPDGDAGAMVQGRVGGDDMTFVRAIVLAGGGIGLLPSYNCAADLIAGRLVRVLPKWHARGATLYLLHPQARTLPARVTAFRDYVMEAFATRRGPADEEATGAARSSSTKAGAREPSRMPM
jgi:DNA-binding transcriptional LysR family regulator